MTNGNDTNITTDRLLLRPFNPSDFDDLFALNSDDEVMQYICPPLDKEQVSSVIHWFCSEWARLGYGWFAVFEQEGGAFVGQCGLQCLEGKPDADDVELAFVISRKHWGKGYATEAAQAITSFGTDTCGLRRIIAVTMEGNARA